MRGPDESGEISKAYALDLEAHGRDVRKVRALKLIEGIEELHNLRAAMEATDPDAVRESRAHDRVPLTSWLDSSGRVLLIADGKTRHIFIRLAHHCTDMSNKVAFANRLPLYPC